VAGSIQIRPDPGHFGQIHQIRPESGPSASGFRWLDIAGFRQPTITGFQQSDIKCVCKDEEFNFEKRFTVFKTVNRFPKIKQGFMVKPKMIFVPTKHSKIPKLFFKNHFIPKQTEH
jgi:hypothetical protein